jgi:Rad3-related DNA helicase
MSEKEIAALFPDGYTPYKNQLDAISSIIGHIEAGKKFLIVRAPTGTGKSVISHALANYTRDIEEDQLEDFNDFSCLYGDDHEVFDHYPLAGAFALTISKSLQNQYLEMFDHMSSLKGKGNYRCAVDPDSNMKTAPCSIAKDMCRNCFADGICSYYNNVIETLSNKFSVLNYAKFLSMPEHHRRRQMIICDEASELESEIVKYYGLEISYEKLEKVGITTTKLMTDNYEKVLAWLNDLFDVINSEIGRVERAKKTSKSVFENGKQTYRKEFKDKLKYVISYWSELDYIVEFSQEGAKMTPYRIDSIAHELYDNHEQVILMSATIVDVEGFAKNLGITDYAFVDIDSTFDSAKSPIYVSNRNPLSFKTMEQNLPLILNDLEQIVELHKNEKGIIHTHTGTITKEVKKRFGKNKRFLFREEGVTNDDIVKQHMESDEPTILVSPSLSMGLDLKGDDGRWFAVLKLPYLPLNDKRIKRRCDDDFRWYNSEMLKMLIQQCGRCTRSKTDESVGYILDGAAFKAFSMNRKILPKYFIDRLK